MVPTDGDDAAPRGRKAASPEPARHEQKYGSRSERPVRVDAVDLGEDTPIDDATPAPMSDTQGRAWREASVGTVSFWDKDGDLLKTIYLGEMPSYRKLGLAARLEHEFAAVHAQGPTCAWSSRATARRRSGSVRPLRSALSGDRVHLHTGRRGMTPRSGYAPYVCKRKPDSLRRWTTRVGGWSGWR